MTIVIVEQFAVGPLQCNCIVLGDERTHDAIVIDPGDECAVIFEVLQRHGLRLRMAVATHGHIDHVGALAELKQRTGADALLHEADLPLYEQLALQAAWLGVPVPALTAIDRRLQGGETLAVGAHGLRVIHTPGHSPGSVSLLLESDRPTVFSGDTLFASGVGRTDLWGGSLDSLLASIRDCLLVMPDETVIVPGHGPRSSIGRERTLNPFLQGDSPLSGGRR